MVQEEIKYAIIGLGNPGKEYLNSRHNIGFQVLDFLADQYQASRPQIECFAVTRTAILPPGHSLLLVKPATFMNLSGRAVGQLVQQYHLSASQLLILHDDLDLPFLQIRFKNKGQSGGHRGIESICQFLHTDQFVRFKIGIGRPGLYEDPVEYVLSPFSKSEQREIRDQLPVFQEAIECWIINGFHQAANRFNRKSQPDNG